MSLPPRPVIVGFNWWSPTRPMEANAPSIFTRLALPNSWASFDDIELIPGQVALSILGADISSLKKSEDKGGVYKYSDGIQADALQILKDNGLNYARLRVWVNPADGYHDKAEILAMASRLEAHGD